MSLPAPPDPTADAGAPARDLRQHAGVQRVLAALAVHGVEPRVVVLPDAARTAAAAAAALGVTTAEIVDGIDHLDRADADFVRAATGFAIGGVAPVGHPAPIQTVVDVSLSRYL